MKVVHFDAARTCEPEPGWRRVSLCGEPSVSIEYFVKPSGHASPLHDHPQDQVMVVIEGRMKVRTADAEEVLGVGDAAFFPGGEPHAVENAREEPSIGIDVFVPGRSFDFWLERLRKPPVD